MNTLHMTGKRNLGGALMAIAFVWTTTAAVGQAEHLVVPLSDPSKPAELEVSLVMGSIKVTGGATREVVIDASSRSEAEHEKDKGRDRPGERAGMKRIPNTAIGLEAEEDGNLVSISAQSWARAVDLEIQVPVGSTVRLSTVNDGDIRVENIDGEVEVSNTNGEISVLNVRGPVSANTVNGDVTVVFRGAMVAAPMAFSTLNGDVDVTFPADLKATVRLQSDNGEIYSDFDVAVLTENLKGPEEKKEKGRFHVVVSREMIGKINGGGSEILFKTFNGDILLRRAGK
ncbi:MAG: DUF4097 family beta strand repeat-containing protein [Thermoanaerobaculia bacterium]